MLPWEHILLGLFPMIHLWQSISPSFSIVFILSSILIDVDHYILVLYAKKFKIWDIKRIYKFFELKRKTHEKIHAIYVFHSIELLILLTILYFSTNWIYFLAILFGILYHILFDILEVAYLKYIRKKRIHFKNYSIIWFLIKK